VTGLVEDALEKLRTWGGPKRGIARLIDELRALFIRRLPSGSR
jgi:hypothetical protein